MKTITVVIISICIYSSSLGQMNISNIKDAVAFFYLKNNKGVFEPQGTGFFVSIPIPSNPTYSEGYIVTAKHVLLDESQKNYRSEIYLRLSLKKDSTLTFVRIPLFSSGDKKNIYDLKDPSVDIAVIEFVPGVIDVNKYNMISFSSSMLLSKSDYKTLNIEEGTEVFFVGMFVGHLGLKKNYPITRFGKIALMTDEKIDWNGYSRDVYLLEATTYWGNSGSPVFFKGLDYTPSHEPKRVRIGPSTVYKLAGVMNGFFGNPHRVGADINNNPVSVLINYGLAAVTPSYLLYDILFGEELRKKRGW